MWGETFSPQGFGVYGTNSSSSSGTRGGAFRNGQDTYVNLAYYDGSTKYGVQTNGLISGIFPFQDHGKIKECATYATLGTESAIEDFGIGELVNGQVVVKIDAKFLSLVSNDRDNPLKIFLQPYGDCNQLYVVPSQDHFQVKETGNGASSIQFAYRIIGTARGMENKRLETVESFVAPTSPGEFINSKIVSN